MDIIFSIVFILSSFLKTTESFGLANIFERKKLFSPFWMATIGKAYEII